MTNPRDDAPWCLLCLALFLATLGMVAHSNLKQLGEYQAHGNDR